MSDSKIDVLACRKISSPIPRELLGHSAAIGVFIQGPSTPGNEIELPNRNWSVSAIKPHSSNSDESFPSPEMSRYVDSKEIEDVIEAERRIQAEAQASALRQMKALNIAPIESLSRSNSLLLDSILANCTPEPPKFLLTSPASSPATDPKIAFSSPMPGAEVDAPKCAFAKMFNQSSPLSTISKGIGSSIELKRHGSGAENASILLPPSAYALESRTDWNKKSHATKLEKKMKGEPIPCEIEQFILENAED